MALTRLFRDVSLDDVSSVGGKNASLGELLRELGPLGVRVPDGFAVTAEAYRSFLQSAGLEETIAEALRGLDKRDVDALAKRAAKIRECILGAALPSDLVAEIAEQYTLLSGKYGEDATDVAVRSSATAEDLPGASFAGQQETFLDVRGIPQVLDAVRKAFASLFTARAVSYREDMGFGHTAVALSVGIQKMVRADRASAGVIFTLDPETGHRGLVLVTSSWGLGESVVQGRVAPDQFLLHKATLEDGFSPILRRRRGTKEVRLVYDAMGVRSVDVSEVDRGRWSVSDEDVLQLSRWALAIESHYSQKRGEDTPMDIEWAKDGDSGELFVVQARPETVHAGRARSTLQIHHLREHGRPILNGLAIGQGIAAGKANVIHDAKDAARFQPGEVLVTEITDPDWEPIMKRAAAIVTNRGGRTSHAAIVARELGIPAIVGATGATESTVPGAMITVSCAEGEVGHIYSGAVAFDVEEIDTASMKRPKTQILLNVGDPDQAIQRSLLPSDGVGLARMEFVFASWVGVHPLALTRYDMLSAEDRAKVDRATQGYTDRPTFFVDRLAEGIGTIAAAFHPRPVILRFSDFKTNEYAKLTGGASFEPREGNPMLGWRGASRYYHPRYEDGFLLECAAVKKVRDVFGLRNLKVMVPFCRTPEEGARVLETMAKAGLVRGQDGLDVYVMAEIPSNIILADKFAKLFDGFSIGSNDLTQLTLGVDRDSTTIASLFDEQNEAVKWSCARLVEVAHRHGCKVGICGQAPSDHPAFAEFLVALGIDSLSLSPDSLVRTTRQVQAYEETAERRRTPYEVLATPHATAE